MALGKKIKSKGLRRPNCTGIFRLPLKDCGFLWSQCDTAHDGRESIRNGKKWSQGGEGNATSDIDIRAGNSQSL